MTENDTRTWRERVASMSPLIVGLIGGTIFFIGTAAFRASDGRPFGVRDLLIYAGGGAFFGAVLALLNARQRKRGGGIDAVFAVNAAQRSGQLPAGAQRSEWLPRLQQRRRSHLLAAWLSPVVFGLIAALGVWVFISTGEVSVVALIPVVVLGAFAVGMPIWSLAQVKKIDRMISELGPDETRHSPQKAT